MRPKPTHAPLVAMVLFMILLWKGGFFKALM
jgi:hypothetical protein